MARVAFKQCDVERLLRAAKAVGYPNPVVENRPGGVLRLLTKPAETQGHPSDGDEALDAEIEELLGDDG